MADSQLNSVHLANLPRREEFRRARARLRAGCGDHTIAGDLRDIRPSQQDGSPTCVHFDGQAQSPTEVRCFLQGQDGTFSLAVGMNTLGRLPDNDVVIPDPSISRRHCAIVVHSDLSCEVHDTASKNGLCVNGKRVTAPMKLVHGDVIDICDHRLTFTLASATPSPSSSEHTFVE